MIFGGGRMEMPDVNATARRQGHRRNQSGFERRQRTDGQRGAPSFRHLGPAQRLAINGVCRPSILFLLGCLVGEPSTIKLTDWK
jgi:hypothetical protein